MECKAAKLFEEVLGGIMACTNGQDDNEMREAMASHLRDNGWYVAENDRELKELAMDECGLVEPE